MATVLAFMMTKPPKNNFRKFWTTLFGIYILDQTSKYIVRAHCSVIGGFPITLIDKWLYINPSFNTGAAWSMFSKNAYALGIVGCFALVTIFLARKKLEVSNYQYAFGLICGGIIGNIIDRFLFGCVTDFIDVNLQIYRWPTFNIADSAICIGVIYYTLKASMHKSSAVSS